MVSSGLVVAMALSSICLMFEYRKMACLKYCMRGSQDAVEMN